MTRKSPTYVPGKSTHRRTEADYMGVLLETVPLEEWRDVVAATVAAAKAGDASARAWLAQYLVGKPGVTAPTALTVVVQQLTGRDPVIDKLASEHVNRLQYPGAYDDEYLAAPIKVAIREELDQQSNPDRELAANQEPDGSPDDFGKI